MLLSVLATAITLVLSPLVFALPMPVIRSSPPILPPLQNEARSQAPPSLLPSHKQLSKRESSKYKGYVLAQGQSGTLFYVNGTTTVNGIFDATLLNSTTGALEVSFEADLYDNNTAAAYVTLNVKSPHTPVNKQYPYISAVRGFYNTGDGNLNGTNRNYAYLSLSSQMVAAGPSAPGGNLFNTHYSTNETEETAIWTYTTADQAIGAQWINADNSTTPIAFIATQGEVLMTGNATAFINYFGGEQIYLYFLEN